MNDTPTSGHVSMSLVVIYSEHLEESCSFYTRLGLVFDKEKHGAGPEHYAAKLRDGTVLELYPATEKRPATNSRLGFRVTGNELMPELEIGHQLMQDPDGRIVEVYAS